MKRLKERWESKGGRLHVSRQVSGMSRCTRCFYISYFKEAVFNLHSSFQAWSSIIHTLIPNISLITSHLTYLRDLCLCVEAVMFEAETFLVIAKSGSPLDCDPSDLDAVEAKAGAKDLDRQRFEKISEIIKGFRKVCQYVSPLLPSQSIVVFVLPPS